MNEITTLLKKETPNSIIIEDAEMKEYTSFKAGGKASLLVVPQSVSELKQTVHLIASREIPFMIMGNGTNLLIRDGGYHGVVIRLSAPLAQINVEGNVVSAGAGASLAVVARTAMEAGLSGLEFASGIPGSLGGGIFMNAGAYGGELKDVTTSVQVLDRKGEHITVLSSDEMMFGYRHSKLMETGGIVLSASFSLKNGEKQQIAATMKEYTDRRNQKQPMDLPSAGSFFKRPEGHFAGKLIQDAGLAGLTVGGAQVSTKHCGFLVNQEDATATDIITLMHLVQATVLDQSGILLEPEVRIIGEDE